MKWMKESKEEKKEINVTEIAEQILNAIEDVVDSEISVLDSKVQEEIALVFDSEEVSSKDRAAVKKYIIDDSKKRKTGPVNLLEQLGVSVIENIK